MQNSHIVPWYVKLVLAVMGGLLACAAIGVDLVNAYLYGLTVTPTMAVLAMIVAIAVVLLPMWLELGAPRILWGLWVLVVGATMYCAFQYYTVSAKQNNLSANTTHTAYLSAEQDKQAARTTLKTITERGDVEELKVLAANADATLTDAKANVEKYCIGKKVKQSCSDAKETQVTANTAMTLAHTKLSDAKARDKAQAILAKASDAQTKGDAVEKDVDVYALLGALVLVQCLAGLSGVATKLGADALRERAAIKASQPVIRSPRVRRPAPIDPTNGGTEQALPTNVIHLHAQRALLRKVIAEKTVKAANMEIRGCDIRRLYERATGHKITAIAFRELLATALPGDEIVSRNNGYVLVGYALKTVMDAERHAVAR